MFFKKYELTIAWRYLKSKRKDGFISVISFLSFIGITLGVATLIVVMSVMNGFRNEMLSKILGMNGHITVISKYAGKNITNYKQLSGKIENIKEIKDRVISTVPSIEMQVMGSSNNNSFGAMVRGLDFDDMQKIKPLFESVKTTIDKDKFNTGEILIGQTLAKKMGVWIGDEITIATAKGNITAFGTFPRIKSYTIVDVFKTGMSSYDANYIYMNLNEAQTFFNMKDQVDFIEVFLQDADTATTVTTVLNKNIDNFYIATNWKNQNSSFVSALDVERNVMFLILSLIILVASFNIVSSLVMLVKDKSFDIAILRTIGATKASVMKIFLLSGGIIGFVGTISGGILGLIVSYNIEDIRQFLQKMLGKELFSSDVYFLSTLPSKIDYLEFFWVIIASFVISLLATIYPSKKAAKQEPVNVLRYE